MKSLAITRFDALDYACNEALNTLCTNLTYAGSNIKRVMITSCMAADGKSFLSINMMRTFAALGKKVVYVCGDLRRFAIMERHGIRILQGAGQGMTHYLAGMCELSDVLYSTNLSGAFMIPVGREVINSLALLSTKRFPAMLDELDDLFDIILIDSPPIGLIIDAAEIAKSCDGALLVVSYNKIRRRDLNWAKHQIELTGCMVLGAVLNNVSFDSYTSKRYYNKSYYTSCDASDQNKPKKQVNV